MDFLNRLVDIVTDFNDISVALRLILALVMGGLIGMERGLHGRAAGMRTHILVCVGACMTALVGIYIMRINPGENITRIAAQVISGIGFLGAGTIMIRNQSVITGLTTAAGVWCTATIGIALGYGFYLGAIVATVIALITATWLTRLETGKKNLMRVYLELEHPDQVSVTETEGPEAVILELHVAEDDMGKVIGKQGRIAKAIRAVVKAATLKNSKPVFVEIQ